MLTLLPLAAALQEADAATPPPLASQDTSGALVSQSKKPSSQASTVGPASSTGMQTPVVSPVVQQAEMRPASAQATSTQGVIQAASEAPAALTGAAAAASAVQDVVVTAPSNTSMAQKATASIDVVGGEQLEQNAVPDITTLIQSMAGVSLKTEGVGQTEIEMRGMTSSGGNSPTAGFYLDNIPLTPPSGAQNGKVVISPALYDMESVEVLRGPQGTQFGAGAMGGAVKLMTVAPDPSGLNASIQAILSRAGGWWSSITPKTSCSTRP